MESETDTLQELPAADASPISDERTSEHEPQGRGNSSRALNRAVGGEDLSHQCEFVAGPAPWKGNKKSAIWKYFSHLDMDVHPDMRYWRICNVCRRKGVDKAVNVTESSSTGKLIDHLKRSHHDEYIQFQIEREEKLKERVVNKEAVGGPVKPIIATMKKRKMERGAAIPQVSRVVPGMAGVRRGDEKSSEELMQEELYRLLEIQKIAEQRLDEISDRLEGGTAEKISPFDLAMLQDRKESAVKNVQAVGRKVDALCDKLNNNAVYV